MIFPRRVQPELLDHLPADAPAAVRSRRDLRVINFLMGNVRWFRRRLPALMKPGEGVLEIGAGDGALGSLLMRDGMGSVTGVDLAKRPASWPARAAWFQGSVFSFDGWAAHPVVIGNLVFHHFNEEELAALGAQLNRHARLILASEPLRSKKALRWFAALCPVMRADPVTRHDGRVSIEAGFFGDELARVLKLDPALWSWRSEEGLFGASRLIAERRP